MPSTSPSLSIEGDNLFRLVPDDTHQGKIIAERMIQDGIKVIVPFWRGISMEMGFMRPPSPNLRNWGEGRTGCQL